MKKWETSLTYRADGVDWFALLGVILTNKDQPVALEVNHSVSKPELAVLSCEWLKVTFLAGQGCLVQPLISAHSKQHVSQTGTCNADRLMTSPTRTIFAVIGLYQEDTRYTEDLMKQRYGLWDFVTGL